MNTSLIQKLRNLAILIFSTGLIFSYFNPANAQCAYDTTLTGTISDYFGSAANTVGVTYYVTGNVIVDRDFEFLDCTLLMAANVEIIIDPDPIISNIARLEIDNSYITECDGRMWGGIRLETSNSRIWVHNSTIEYAMIGVNVRSNGEIVLDTSEFNLNQIHVNLLPASNAGTQPAWFNPRIDSCRFVSEIPNTSTPTQNGLLSPVAGRNPETGIRMIRYDASNSNFIIRYSKIDNATTGIRNFNSVLHMLDDQLSNIYGDGVLVERDAHLYWNTTQRHTTSYIKNARVGIRLRNHNPEILIDGVLFQDVLNAGINSNMSGIDAEGTITNNLFRRMAWGVFLRDTHTPGCNTGVCFLNITNNTFENIRGIGINVIEATQSKVNIDYDIHNNNFDPVGSGIRVLNLIDPEILGNGGLKVNTGMNIGFGWVIFNNYFGITANNCINPQIRENYVTTHVDSKCKLHYVGVEHENCSGGLAQCNESENMGVGLRFDANNNPPPDINRNIMGESIYGFHLLNSNLGLGNIGSLPNTVRDNQWSLECEDVTPLTPAHTFAEFSNAGFGNFTRFIVRNSGLPFDPASHFKNPPAAPQFNICTDLPVTTSSITRSCPLIMAKPQKEIIDKMLSYVEGDFDWPYFANEMKWKADYLYYKWAINTDSIVGHDTLSPLANYRDYVKDSTSIGDLLGIEDSIGCLSSDSNIFADQSSYVKTELANFEYENKVDSNYIVLYTLYIDHYRKNVEDYDSTALDTLRSLADQCYLEGGFPVHMARTMLTELNDSTISFTDDCEMPASEERIKQVSTEKKFVEFKIMPNPSTGVFNIVSEDWNHLNAKYTIYNLLGSIIMQGLIDEENFRIDMSEADKGMYIISIDHKFGKFTQKLILTE